MDSVQLLTLSDANKPQFIADMQHAFRAGAQAAGQCEEGEEILPAADIAASLAKPGAAAWQAVLGGRMVGGAIVVINAPAQRGSLELFYVRHGQQGRGLGQAIWHAIEQRHPDIQCWETFTPWFEKRNIHFYINCLGFRAVEFFCARHTGPAPHEDMEAFRFEKRMPAPHSA